MSYVPQVPRRPVPTYADLQSQASLQAAPARVDSFVGTQAHVDTSDEAYAQAMRVIAARQAQSTFVQDPAARQNEGLSDGYAYEMQAPALPQRRQPAQTAPMRVPEPVYIGRQPDVYVLGTDSNHLIDNHHVHVEHNQRAYARHEGQIEAMAATAQRPTGRAAHWPIEHWMEYTSDIRSTGMTKEQLNAFEKDIQTDWNAGVTRVWDITQIIAGALVCGLNVCVGGIDALKRDAWSPSSIDQRMAQVCRKHNAAMEQAGVAAIFRHVDIPGVGHYLEIHHAG